MFLGQLRRATMSRRNLSSTDTLAGFVAVGQHVSCFDPSANEGDNHSLNSEFKNHPQLIVIFGWMGARAVHLQKYTDYYTSLYPKAYIVVARSWPSFFWSSARARQLYLEPLVHVLRERGVFSDRIPPLLVHSFSNGGLYLLTDLSRIISSTKDLGTIRGSAAASCLILDSCPGPNKYRFFAAGQAVAAPIQSPILKFLATVVFSVAWVGLAAIRWLTRQPNLVEEMRLRLNNPHLFPGMSKATPRLYLYSDTDLVIPSKAVEEHIAEAKREGFDVQAELFHGSAHVSHARKDPERYWGAIRSAWDKAVKMCREAD